MPLSIFNMAGSAGLVLEKNFHLTCMIPNSLNDIYPDLEIF